MTRPEPRKFTFDQRFDDAAGRAAPPRAKKFYTQDEVEAVRAEAYEKGRGALEAVAAQAQSVALGQVAEAAMTALTTLESMAAEARAEALQVGLAAAKRIADVALQRFPLDTIEKTIAHCLAEAAHEARIVIAVAPSVVEALRARIQNLTDEMGFAGRIVVVAETRLGGADCRLEWTDGGVERDAAAITRRIEAALDRFVEADRRRAEDSIGA